MYVLGQASIRAVTFSPNGQLVATASYDKTAGVWEIASGHRLASFVHEASVTAVAFSLDRELLITASEDRTVGVWEVPSGRRLASLAHEASVTAMAFSLDGRWLVTGCDDKTVRVWDFANSRQIMRLTHEENVSAVALSPHHQYLATASGRVVKLWLYRPEDLIVKACSHLARNLTLEEWQQYIGKEQYRKTCPNLPEDEMVSKRDL